MKEAHVMFNLMPRRHNQVVSNNSLFDSVENFFNDDFGNFFNMPSLLNEGMFSNGGFRMDVKENDSAYTIEAELPGVNKEDIALDFNNGNLYIAVNHNEDINNDRDNYVHRERRSFQMQRSIYLGDIDVQGINASMDNGILRITAPKLNIEPASYRIDIR